VTDIIHLNQQKLESYRGDYDTFEKTRMDRLKNQLRVCRDSCWFSLTLSSDQTNFPPYTGTRGSGQSAGPHTTIHRSLPLQRQESFSRAVPYQDASKDGSHPCTHRGPSPTRFYCYMGCPSCSLSLSLFFFALAASHLPSSLKRLAPPQDPSCSFSFPDPEELPPPLVQFTDVSFAYPSRGGLAQQRNIFENITFDLDMESRVALVRLFFPASPLPRLLPLLYFLLSHALVCLGGCQRSG